MPPQVNPREDDVVGHPPSADHVARKASLQRIADALHVSPAVLYEPLNAIHEASRSGEQTDDYGGHDGQCSALIHAFMRISDPEERRRILALVQASAKTA